MKDCVYLHGLQVSGRIGTNAWEQKVAQNLSIDIDLFFDQTAAAKSDDYKQTVDYAAVAELVEREVQQSSFALLEALADFLAKKILDKFEVEKVRIKIDKGKILKQVANVGVCIERST